jgi:hypothetical protein
MKYINNNKNDGALVEAQRTIDKRTMWLEVQLLLLLPLFCGCVNICTNKQISDCIEICSDLSALGHVKELWIARHTVSNFEETVCKAWARQLKWLVVILFCSILTMLVAF